MTTSVRKSTLTHLVAGSAPGAALSETLRDSVIAAMQTNMQVTVVHNNKQYIVNPETLLRLLAVQSPLVTGKHLVRGGPT